MTKDTTGKFGGPYTVIKSNEERAAMLAAQRRNDRFILEQIIADDEDETAVERAKEKLAALDAKGAR